MTTTILSQDSPTKLEGSDTPSLEARHGDASAAHDTEL